MKYTKELLEPLVKNCFSIAEIMRKLDLKDSNKFTGGKYYFIDTMDSTGEYLIIQNNNITTNSVK